MNESNQRIAVTKRMIKEGLIRLLAKKPLEKISITELCQKSGINRTTFYRHYQVPMDVLKEMQRDFFEEAFEEVQNPLTFHDTYHVFRCLYQHAELVKLFFQYNSDKDWTAFFAQIYESFPEKKKLKAFQNLDENGSRLLSTYLAGGIYFLVRQWILEEIPLPPEEVAAIALNILDKDLFC